MIEKFASSDACQKCVAEGRCVRTVACDGESQPVVVMAFAVPLKPEAPIHLPQSAVTNLLAVATQTVAAR